MNGTVLEVYDKDKERLLDMGPLENRQVLLDLFTNLETNVFNIPYS